MTRILVVDDIEQNLYLLRVLFEGHGYQVVTARNGSQALEMAGNEAPDMIISDILMPVMDGFTLCKEWKKDEQLKPIPFVFYTATYTDAKDEQLALSLGAVRFIVKPSEPDDFIKIIEEVVTEYEAGRLPMAQETPSEEIVYKQYNEALIRKLEDKMLQLEKANRDLANQIEERQQVAGALKESEERFRSIIEQSRDGIAITDEEGTLFVWNPGIEYITGLPAENIIGKKIWDMQFEILPDTEQTPKRWETLKAALGKILETGEAPWANQLQTREYNRPDGTRSFLEWVVFPISTAKGFMLGNISRDITERKRAEEALLAAEKMIGLGILAAGIAHEINSPLQVITGISESMGRRMQKNELEEDEVGRLHTLNRNAWRIAEIIKALLLYSRPSSDEMEKHNLNQVIGETLLLIKHQLKTWSNISVNTNLDPSLPDITCDRNRISQVLINLLNNARDAMPQGGQIILSTTFDSEQRRIILTVKDTGTGIPLETQRKIYDPFYTTKDIGKGTGLGLSIVKGIVLAHNGAISVNSTPSTGSCFTLTFPVDFIPADPIQSWEDQV